MKAFEKGVVASKSLRFGHTLGACAYSYVCKIMLQALMKVIWTYLQSNRRLLRKLVPICTANLPMLV